MIDMRHGQDVLQVSQELGLMRYGHSIGPSLLVRAKTQQPSRRQSSPSEFTVRGSSTTRRVSSPCNAPLCSAKSACYG